MSDACIAVDEPALGAAADAAADPAGRSAPTGGADAAKWRPRTAVPSAADSHGGGGVAPASPPCRCIKSESVRGARWARAAGDEGLCASGEVGCAPLGGGAAAVIASIIGSPESGSLSNTQRDASAPAA